MTKKSQIDPLEFMKIRLEGCRKGGLKSGMVRRPVSRKHLVEAAITNEKSSGKYTHNSASRIAKYLGVTPRYVRRLAMAHGKKEEQTLGSVPLLRV